ncbi:zinc ribbon domain-containing protein [Halomicroarcula sp. GCM10025709]|uniref:zinc ribbon domain-containing protein n=1 Tax=Haloarcula TaxID=2237 RepID=UPI0024C2BF77|nr:zinc ribbon domain-containing protein [Halomicroarcula sp. YJ-61-S]
MSDTGRKRPWLAVCLAFIYPGLGHVYLREWLRAVLWFGLVFSTTTLLLGEGDLPTELSVDAFLAASRALPLEASVALLAITLLSMADAYWMAARTQQDAAVSDGMSCPNCGKELDEDIDFCHWCTTELSTAEDTGADAAR